jgi:sugar lactone lactonase YvrE
MIKIIEMTPSVALPGGNILIRWMGKPREAFSRPTIYFNDLPAHLISASSELIVAQVPADARSGKIWLTLEEEESSSLPIEIARLVASDLHPVANPALDPSGSIYTTLSGRRGEKVSNSVFRIEASGKVQAFVTDLMNPTGLAFNSQGELFISSRHDENVYKVSPFGEKSIYTKGMGVATGIAFDREDNLYVGDRSGNVFKINRKREVFVFATLEPSVSAYHLAFDNDQNLYLTGPTTSSVDHIYQITSNGTVSIFYSGLGRPQGLAFDNRGNLYVAASLEGRRGIVSVTPKREARIAVSGSNLVGLAFGSHHDLYLCSTDSIYHADFNIVGKPLP